MAILLDFSQAIISACYAFSDDLCVDNPNKDEARNILRHVVLSQIKSYKQKYSSKYGDLIICCDGKHYWRRDLFKPYKACRKKSREGSSLDWKLIFEIIDTMVIDLKENFPYKVIQYDRAEGDDIIATMTEYFQKNEVTTNGLFVFPQELLIISSDRDLIQLHKYTNVHQISPKDRKAIIEPDPESYLKEKIIKGDKGDGIPNILSEDEVFLIEGSRQKAVTAKRLSEYMAFEDMQKYPDELIAKRFKRNSTLIGFDSIPQDIKDEILKQYHEPIVGNKGKIFNYLLKNGCNQLLTNINDF